MCEKRSTELCNCVLEKPHGTGRSVVVCASAVDFHVPILCAIDGRATNKLINDVKNILYRIKTYHTLGET